MPLELSLVIKGEQSGAKKAIDDTASGIENLGSKAKAASQPTKEVAEGVAEIATEAPQAKTAIDQIGSAVDTVKVKFGGWQAAALGAIGGIAGALGSAVLGAAIDGAVTAIGGYFDEVTNSAANVESDIEAHKALISSIKGLWDQAKGAASNYGLTTQAGLQFEARSNVMRLDSDFQSAMGGVSSSGIFSPTRAFMAVGDVDAMKAPFTDAIAKLREDLKDGRADIIAFREEVATIANGLPIDSDSFKFAEEIMGDTDAAAKLQAELQRSVDMYRALTGDAEAAAIAMGKSAESMTTTGSSAESSLPALREYVRLMSTLGGGRMDSVGESFSFADIAGSGLGGAPKQGGWLSWLGFADGGYTGHQPTDQVAGFVHGREYVFDAASTAAIGVGNLDAIRRGVKGYASGGGVGIPAIGSPIGNGSFGFDLAGSFSLLKGVALDLAGALRSTKDSAGAVNNVLGNLAGKFLSAAGSMFDKANPGLGGIGGLLASLFGGFFADGGDMQAGKFYAVGERGMELFAPGMSGTMIPNHALGGGGSFTQNIRNYSGQPIKTAERRGPDGSIIQDMVIGTTKRAIADDEFRSNGLRGPTKSR